jgi:hypothetical protein
VFQASASPVWSHREIVTCPSSMKSEDFGDFKKDAVFRSECSYRFVCTQVVCVVCVCWAGVRMYEHMLQLYPDERRKKTFSDIWSVVISRRELCESEGKKCESRVLNPTFALTSMNMSCFWLLLCQDTFVMKIQATKSRLLGHFIKSKPFQFISWVWLWVSLIIGLLYELPHASIHKCVLIVKKPS